MSCQCLLKVALGAMLYRRMIRWESKVWIALWSGLPGFEGEVLS